MGSSHKYGIKQQLDFLSRREMKEVLSCASLSKQESLNKQNYKKEKNMGKKENFLMLFLVLLLSIFGACSKIDSDYVLLNASDNTSQIIFLDDISSYSVSQIKQEVFPLLDRFLKNQYGYIQGTVTFSQWAMDFSLSGDSSLQNMKSQIDDMVSYGGRFQSISGMVSLDEYTKKTKLPLTTFVYEDQAWTISGIFENGQYLLRGESSNRFHSFLGYYVAKVRKENGVWKLLSFKAFEPLGPFLEELLSEPVGYWSKEASLPVDLSYETRA